MLPICTAFCFPFRTVSTSTNKAALCTGKTVLFHFLSGGAGDTKDSVIEKPLLRQDDNR